MQLTLAESRLLKYFVRKADENKIVRSAHKDIASNLRVTVRTVHSAIKELELRGLITKREATTEERRRNKSKYIYKIG